MTPNDVEDGKSKQDGRRCKIVFVVLLVLAMLACIIALAVLLVQAREDVSRTDDDVTTSPPPTPPPPSDERKSHHGSYKRAAVAADAAVCSKIGVDFLLDGGSGVDAAIGTLLCLGVVHCQSMGIGGGFFMTIYDPSYHNVTTLLSRERAPLGATEDMYVTDMSKATYGGAASGVPGEVAGYWAAHQRFGRLPWADLFTPAIRLCEDGFTVTNSLASAISSKWNTSDSLRQLVWNTNTNTYYKEGELMRNSKLGATLRRIAADATSFYSGSLADDIVADLTEHGGIITNQDLHDYRVRWKDPVTVQLQRGNYELYGPPPPSSSLVTNLILNILDEYDLSADDLTTADKKTELLHRVTESMKFAFAKRSLFGDEDYINITSLKAELQTDQLAAAIRANITDVTHPLEYYGPAFQIVEDSGTSHMSLLAQDGTAVAATSTVNLHFGSKVVGTRTGIIFNNEMDDFSTPGTSNAFGVPASASNFIEPGKSPMSSMSPTIVLNSNSGEVVMLSGASGGTKIITGTALSILNALRLGMNVSDAVDAIRLHHQLVPDRLEYERTLDKNVVSGLDSRGHNTIARTTVSAVVQALLRRCSETPPDPVSPLCVTAACDFRKGGAPDGY